MVRQTGTISANSSFKLNGGELRFKDTIDDGGATKANIGVLSGSGGITRDGGGSALGNLTVLTAGIEMGNDAATDTISFGWGSTVTFSGAPPAISPPPRVTTPKSPAAGSRPHDPAADPTRAYS